MSNVTIFVPAFGGQISAATTRSLMALGNAFAAKGIGGSFSTHSFPEISELRNMALTMWFDTMPQSDYLLFVDADMGFAPELVLDMITFGEPVMGTVYPKKSIERDWVVSGDPGTKVEVRGGFLKCLGVGMGVALIRRDAVAKMVEAYPELSDPNVRLLAMNAMLQTGGATRILRLFDPINDPNLGRISEDLSFCRRWTDIDGEVWAAIGHKVEHVGLHSHIGCYGEEMSSPEAVAPGFKVVEGCFKIVEGKRGIFKYNPNDTFIGRSLEAYGEWTEFELELLEQVIKPGDMVLDVGANIGTHTVAFSKMVGPTGTVMAFEAQPRLFNLLKDNVILNRLENVKGICGVVMDRHVDRVGLHQLPPDDSIFNFGALPATSEGIGLVQNSAPGDTIDALELERCDVIKIDVEGMEPDVLRGARATIERFKPVLYIENNGTDSSALWQALEQIGYHARWSIGPYFNRENFLKNPIDIWPGVVPSANVIAVWQGELFPRACLDLPPFLGPSDWWKNAWYRNEVDESVA